FEGANILHRARGLQEVAGQFSISPLEAAGAIQRAGRALRERRAHRGRPGLDDKVVTAWNGLAIRALAEAGAVLDRPELTEAARAAAANFVLDSLSGDGLLRSWAKKRPGPPAVLEDHAALAVGFFSLYATTGEERWYREAMARVRSLDAFADP